MEEGLRKSKGPKRNSGKNEKQRGHEMYDRRPLKTVTLFPPNYTINASTLLDSYVEKEVKYAGIINNIPLHLDTTNRTDVLRVIDRGKKEGWIPWRVTREHDAIFSLTVHNVKISRWGGNEEVLLRVPIHEIAAICYILDDSQHVLALKYGDKEAVPEMCQLAVLYCDNQTSARELCAMINQCFQLVYAEATRQYFDSTVSDAARLASVSSSSATRSDHSNMSTPTASRPVTDMTIFTQSRLDLDQQAGTISTSNESRSHPTSRRPSSATPSESDLSAAAEEQRNEYVKKLHTKLTPEELRRFAVLLNDWTKNNMRCTDFCKKVLDLYGPHRKYLLAGMRPFIPDEDFNTYETFLESNGLGQANINETHSSHNSRFRRTLSGASTFSNHTPFVGDEIDRVLHDISTDIETLGTSVEMNTNPESFMPKNT